MGLSMISLKGINPYAAAVITENILKNGPEKLNILLDADIRKSEIWQINTV